MVLLLVLLKVRGKCRYELLLFGIEFRSVLPIVAQKSSSLLSCGSVDSDSSCRSQSLMQYEEVIRWWNSLQCKIQNKI